MTCLDLTGQKFGRLTVIERTANLSHHKATWLCKCECGTLKAIRSNALKRGLTKSCGCIRRETARANVISGCATGFKHGMVDTGAYKSWKSLKRRCLSSNNKQYAKYGGRGITVCDRWLNSFENFYEDMGDRPEGMSIDRIDNNGNYEPGNCRWATRTEQQNNMRSNRLIEFKGEVKTLSEWAREVGMTHHLLRHRLDRGWSMEESLLPFA